MSLIDPLDEDVAAALVEAPGGGQRRLAMNVIAGGSVNAIKIGIQLVMLPAMAHLLGPAEFGLYALALPTVSFFLTLADGGLGVSLARAKDSETVLWSTAFWAVLMGGVALALIVSGWGVALSVLSQQPRLAGLMSFLSISFILIATAILPGARMTRDGRLVVFAVADLFSSVLGAIVAVSLAAYGAGAWSLAAQYVVGLLIRAVTLNVAAFVPPRLIFQPSILRAHASTGTAVLSARLADFSGRLVENLLYGRTFGTAALGTYTFANQAPRFICEAVSSPIWAALYSHALREEPRSVAATHVKLIHLLALAVFPVAFLLAAAAPEVLAVILGPKWTTAGTLLRILLPAYAIQVLASQSGAVLTAQGRNWELFWATAALVAGRLCAVAAGPWVGQEGVAFGIVATHVLSAIYLFAAPGRTGAASFLSLVGAVAMPALAAVGAAAVCYGMLRAGPTGLVWTGASLCGGGSTYLLLALIFDGRRLHRDVRAIRRLLFQRRRQGPIQSGQA